LYLHIIRPSKWDRKNLGYIQNRGFYIAKTTVLSLFFYRTHPMDTPDTTNVIVFLKGIRVTLRPLQRSDIPLLTKWINDPEVRKFLASIYPQMFEDEEEWYKKHVGNTKHIVLAIIAEGVPIGTIGLHGINHVDGTGTTGTLIGEKEYWGKGYGTEAKMLLLHYAFYTLNLRKIHSSVIEYNERSYDYSIGCGYKKIGVRKKEFYRDGIFHDEILLTVWRQSWKKVWDTYALKYGMPKQF
jgi:RimJ/RimL family protein N-acetyltransferase